MWVAFAHSLDRTYSPLFGTFVPHEKQNFESPPTVCPPDNQFVLAIAARSMVGIAGMERILAQKAEKVPGA